MEYSRSFIGSEIAEEGKEESNDESKEGNPEEAVGVSNASKNDKDGFDEGVLESKASKVVVLTGGVWGNESNPLKIEDDCGARGGSAVPVDAEVVEEMSSSWSSNPPNKFPRVVVFFFVEEEIVSEFRMSLETCKRVSSKFTETGLVNLFSSLISFENMSFLP